MDIKNGIDNLTQLFPTEGSSSSLKSIRNNQDAGDGSLSASKRLNSGDKADVSAAANHLSDSAGASALTPEVRLDKVLSIQNALQSGTYHVSAEDVAKKVVDALLAPGT